MGVLVIRGSAPPLYTEEDAGVLARAIHDKWGIGSARCNNGIYYANAACHVNWMI
jgi:hypothetical protein